jgi:hypothetical protein
MSQYLQISKLRAGPGFARVLVSWFSASVLFYFWSGILDLVIWRTREEHRVSVMAGLVLVPESKTHTNWIL